MAVAYPTGLGFIIPSRYVYTAPKNEDVLSGQPIDVISFDVDYGVVGRMTQVKETKKQAEQANLLMSVTRVS